MSSPQKTFHFWAGSLELENKPAHLLFAKRLEHKFADFHGYLTYRLTNLGRAREEDIPSFLLITKEHGVVAIDVLEERLDAVLVQQDQDFWQLDNGQTILSRSLVLQIYEEEIISRLKNDIRLYDRKTRKLKIPVHSVIVFCKNDDDSLNANSSLSEYAVEVCSLEGFDSYIDSLSTASCQDEELDKVISLLEGTFIYQQPIRYSVDADPESFNDFIQMSLKTTFKQDDAQRAISMQLPNGPQRIRGLAGTGKTIVLSLKAAITHKKFENFKILYLFNTQSLYSQVQSLITKYYSSEAKKAPDFDGSLHVLHAWGGKARKGLYSELCARYGIIPLGFNEVKGKDSDPLKVIYGDLINKLNSRFEEIYDLVLIDEAQDFPEEVFELIFRITKTVDGKKRIVWAYDEFQSLKDSLIKEPEELFGKDAFGSPNIKNEELEGEYAGGIKKDFILPNCYRTPRPVLMMAHGIALGLYGQITQMFYNSKDWEAIGYSVLLPERISIAAGDQVKIKRKDENSKNILESLLRTYNRDPLSLVQFQAHKNWSDELVNISKDIRSLLVEQNVKPEEIVIVNLLSGNNKSSMFDIQRILTQQGVPSVIPGYIESSDVFKPEGFVTITTPFRAKGNEANIVFVVNAQVVANDFTLRGRNAFFVAATRSRGWCFVSGNGNGIEKLQREIESIQRDFPFFKFICPDAETVKSSRNLLRKSDRELDEIQRALSTILGDESLKKYVLDAIKRSDK